MSFLSLNSFKSIQIKLNPSKTIMPDTPKSDDDKAQQKRNPAGGGISPQVETEKQKPASSNSEFGSCSLIGSKATAATAPTEGKQKVGEPVSCDAFATRPISEATITKPAENLFGSSSSNVQKSDVPQMNRNPDSLTKRRSSRKPSKQTEIEKRERWERYLKEDRIDG